MACNTFIMSMTPSQEIQMQMHDQNQSKKPSKPQRLPFRTSCDPCAASKVRCTKEKHGCSRCVLNGSKCVYGRSRRKGKPSTKTITEPARPPVHPPSSRVQMSPAPLAPLAPLALPALSALPTLPDHQPSWPMGPNHHQPNYNYNSTWYRSPPSPTTNYPTPTEWERTSNTLPPSLTHQSPGENAGILHLPNPGYTWPSMVRPREVPEDDQHEPCIAVACRTLSSLYEFVQSDCVSGHTANDTQSRNMLQPPTRRESPANDVVFRMTRSATETVSRLLNCTGRSCARDPSKLLLLGSVLLKVLTWYEALYQSEIGGPDTSSLDNREYARLQPQPYHLNGNTGLSRPFGSMKESILAIPLTTPLGIDMVNISRATETKMKAQVLLWEVQILSHVCQALEHRIQAAESIRGENNLCGQENAYLSRKVGELQRALTVVCTPVPSLG